MTPILADVNLWLATLVTEHSHHRAATRWWRDDVVPAGHRPGFCRLTQLGVLRLLSNERVMGPRRLDHSRAWDVVARVTAQRGVSFLPEPPGIDEHLAGACRGGRFSTGFWTDAYLAAFARAGRYRLATFDRGFRRFEGLDLILLAG